MSSWHRPGPMGSLAWVIACYVTATGVGVATAVAVDLPWTWTVFVADLAATLAVIEAARTGHTVAPAKVEG